MQIECDDLSRSRGETSSCRTHIRSPQGGAASGGETGSPTHEEIREVGGTLQPDVETTFSKEEETQKAKSVQFSDVNDTYSSNTKERTASFQPTLSEEASGGQDLSTSFHSGPPLQAACGEQEIPHQTSLPTEASARKDASCQPSSSHGASWEQGVWTSPQSGAPLEAATPHEHIARHKPFRFRDSTEDNALPPHMAKRYSHIQPHLAPGGAFVYSSTPKRESELQNWEAPVDFLPPPTIVTGKGHHVEEFHEEMPGQMQHRPDINKKPNRASQFISSSQARFKIFKGFLGRNNQEE